MRHFDIIAVINKYELDKAKLADALFPSVKYPKKALGRVLKGKSELNSIQLEKLAEFIGISPSTLFETNSWKSSIQRGYIYFIKREYKAQLNGTNLTLFKNGILVEQQSLSTLSMTLKEFINMLNSIIKTHENGNN